MLSYDCHTSQRADLKFGVSAGLLIEYLKTKNVRLRSTLVWLLTPMQKSHDTFGAA